MRVAVIGCGGVSASHFVGLGRLPEVDVVAACDVDPVRAERRAREYGVPRTYGTAAELLEREQLDAVHIVTPPATHRDMSIAALAAGCHVLVEKPLALEASEADEIVQAAERSGRTLCVCHNFLFAPAVLAAQDLAARGALGTVVATEVFWQIWRGPQGTDDPYAARPWLRELPGRVFHEAAPHCVYLQQAFLGVLRPVAAVSTGADDAPEEFRAVLLGADGIGTAHVSTRAHPRQITLRVYGTRSTAQVDVAHDVLETNPGGEQPVAAVPGVDFWRRGHANLIERFYASLREGAPPPVTAEDGRDVVATLDEVWRLLDG